MKKFLNRKIALAGGAILVLGVTAILLLPRLFPSPEKINLDLKSILTLPELQGAFKVGRTTAYLVNKSQPALPGSKDPREFVVTIFYPAVPAANATPGPYAEDALKTAYSKQSLTQASAGALDLIRTHSYWNAAVNKFAGKYPVLLFSPGGGEQPLFYTSLLEQISSHGYIVVAVPEPFDTPVIPLPDGRILTKTQMDEWCKQNATCQKAMKGDSKAIEEITNSLKDNRAKDMIFTLNELEKINNENPNLAGTLDLKKIGVFGHSFGGAASVRLAQLDNRVNVVSVLDSDIFKVIPTDSSPLSQPVIYLTAANIDETPQGLAEIRKSKALADAYFSKGSPYYFINIAGTTHQSFQSDVMFLAPYISIGGQSVILNSNNTSPARITDIIVAYNVAFFDQYLKKNKQSLLAGPSNSYPEITIVTHP